MLRLCVLWISTGDLGNCCSSMWKGLLQACSERQCQVKAHQGYSEAVIVPHEENEDSRHLSWAQLVNAALGGSRKITWFGYSSQNTRKPRTGKIPLTSAYSSRSSTLQKLCTVHIYSSIINFYFLYYNKISINLYHWNWENVLI